MKCTDIIGKQFGRLTIIEGMGKGKCTVRCTCGALKIVDWRAVVAGRTSSCGCMKREMSASRNTRHGLAHTPTYVSWVQMLQRCNDPNATMYKNYGGRGITVCGRWLKFEHFLEDMGLRPAGMTLGRKDNEGNYEPGNCKWSTRLEQANNSRRSVKFNGKPLKQWAVETGIPYQTLISRMQKFGTIFPPHLPINKK